jgi:putative transposase
MSRALRIQYPGAWYHAMNRGLNRRNIFIDDSHRELFLHLLSEIHNRYNIQIHSYCLMDNHYHLLIHTPKGNLSRAMRHLNSLYTQGFNRQTKRDGPLFRGRYKAILVEAEHYGLELTRYIHCNPVTAKICSNPAKYSWSSYQAYLGRVKKPHWLYCEEMLARCSTRLSIKKYQEFVEGESDISIAEILTKKQFPSVLGSPKWIKEIKERYVKKIEDKEIYISQEFEEQDEERNIKELIQQILDFYNKTWANFKKESKPRAENKLRNWFVYLAVEYGGYEHKEIARSIGNISLSGVTQIKRRLQRRIEKDISLQVELEKLKKKCQFASSVKT